MSKGSHIHIIQILLIEILLRAIIDSLSLFICSTMRIEPILKENIPFVVQLLLYAMANIKRSSVVGLLVLVPGAHIDHIVHLVLCPSLNLSSNGYSASNSAMETRTVFVVWPAPVQDMMLVASDR